MADTRDLKSGGSVSPPNLKSPVKSSVFSFQWPEQAGISLLFSLRPPHLLFEYAAVLESVDKADLKSARILLLYGFESRQRHHSEMTFGCQMTAQARPSRQQRSFFVQTRDRFAESQVCLYTARIPALRRGFLARRGVSSLLHRDRFAGSRCRVTMFAFRASASISTAKVFLRSTP